MKVVSIIYKKVIPKNPFGKGKKYYKSEKKSGCNLEQKYS